MCFCRGVYLLSVAKWLKWKMKSAESSYIGERVTSHKPVTAPAVFPFDKTVVVAIVIEIASFELWFATNTCFGVTKQHHFVTKEHCFATNKCCFVTNKHWFVTNKHCFVTKKHCFVTNKYSFVTNKHCFVTNKHCFVTNKYCFV